MQLLDKQLFQFGAWWVSLCSLPKLPLGAWNTVDDAYGAGCSIRKRDAIRSSVGEAIERYSAIEVWNIAKWSSVSGRENITSQFREKFPESTDDTLFSQTKSTDGQSCFWVPSSLVHLGFRSAPEEAYSVPDSNGLASGLNMKDVIYRGLLEVLERDALMIRWILKASPRRLEFKKFEELNSDLSKRFLLLEQSNTTAFLFDLAIEPFVNTIGCVLLRDSYPYFTLGMGTAASPNSAACKAIDEAVSINFALSLNHTEKTESQFSENSIVTFSDHAKYYALKENLHHVLEFFDVSNHQNSIQFEEIEQKSNNSYINIDEAIDTLTKECENVGLSVQYCDLTLPSLNGKWQVGRVIVPEAYPLQQSGNVEWRVTPRLEEKKFALRTNLVSSFNTAPHPFA